MINVRIGSLIAAALLLVLSPTTAKAAWYEAQSDHFVIYADDSERDIRIFVQNLERYHRAMELLVGYEVPPPSPSNRVVIYVVGTGREVREVLGTDKRWIAGFYIPRAGASRAYVQDIRNTRGGYPDFSTTLLLHEYAHHFLISATRFGMPRWLSEGEAEFFASANFNRDGSIGIGLPARHRTGELYNADYVSIRELLDPELYDKNHDGDGDAFYGRSWLVYHYLTFGDQRRGQLDAYKSAIIGGQTPLEAGLNVFGDLDVLEDEVDDYLKQRRINTFTIGAEHLPVSEVTMRRLPKGEAKIMKVRMVSERGVDHATALELVEDAREIAAEYPNDPGVLTALAEAEYDAGNDAEAIAAADAAIALDPSRTNAYVQKGYALFRMADNADDIDAAIQAAMEPLEALNQIENDHPIPLIYYYRSYLRRGEMPSENARAALEHAARLAPFDQGLWLQVALMQAREGKIALARQSLMPLAASPHGGPLANRAKFAMTILDNREEGKPFELSMVQPTRTVELDVDPPADDDGEDGGE